LRWFLPFFRSSLWTYGPRSLPGARNGRHDTATGLSIISEIGGMSRDFP